MKFHVAGVMVSAAAEHSPQVKAALLQMTGVEVHGCSELGKMVVTIEAADEHQIADRLTEIQCLSGVMAAAMVYHSFDDEVEQEEVVS